MCGRNNIFRSVCNENALRIEKNERYLVSPSWSASLGDIGSEVSLRNNLRLDSGTIERLFKMVSSRTVEVLLNLVTVTMVQVDPCYPTQKVMVAA